MKIVIAGGAGLIGSALTQLLLLEGHEVVILTRKPRQSADPKLNYVRWMEAATDPVPACEGADAFVNLAGVSLNDGRWTHKRKQEIVHSRLEATSEVLRIIEQMTKKPKTLLNASAIGIYPASETASYTEQSSEIAEDFLGQTVRAWEQQASRAENYQIRTVLLRFGVVLSPAGGALPMLLLPYKLFAGGTIGSGKQWVSWVHIDDAAQAIRHAISCDWLQGPVNICSPQPVTMKELGQTIARVLKRPHWLPVPSFLLRLALGEKSTLVLDGQRVLPKALVNNGFQFAYSDVSEALKSLK